MTTSFYTLGEAAARLRVHPQTLRRWIRAGKVTAQKCGKQYRLRAEDLLAHSPLEDDPFGRAALAALEPVWSNEADAVYDDWRAAYGVQEG